jgi:hypothetical protein
MTSTPSELVSPPTVPTLRFRYVRIVLGVLLLLAAGLKLYGMDVSPFAQYGRLMNPTVQVAAIEWETVLGLWLLTGRKPLGAWLAALLTFLIFAGVSLYLGLIGQASCGCFGSVKASPWYAFAIDMAALVLLGIGRPNFRDLREFLRAQWRAAILRGGTLAVGVAVIAGGFLGLASLAFGSIDAALARLRGERISVYPRLVDVGSGQPAQTMKTSVEVSNWTDRTVTILGGTADCSCITTEDLPLTVAPGETRHVPVLVRLPSSPGFFNRKALLWTDCAQARKLFVSLSGKVEQPAEASAAATEK